MPRGKAIKLTAAQFYALVALRKAGTATVADLNTSAYVLSGLTAQGFARRVGSRKTGTVGRPATLYAISARGARKIGGTV